MSGAPDRWWEADPIVPAAAAAAGDRWWEADPVVGRDAAIGDDPSAGWVTTAVSNLGRGAADVVAGIPKQMSIAQAQGNRQVLDIFDRIDASGLRASERRMQPESVGIGDVPVVTMGDIEAYERADDAGRAALRQKYAMTDPREGGGYRAGQWISDRVKAALPVNPEYAEDWLASKIPNALGSAVGFLGLGVAGRAMGMPGAAVAAGGGAAVGGAQQFEDAIAHGASIEDAFKAANLGALVGTSEAVPIGRLLDRLDKGTGGSIKQLIREAIKQGSEEAAQEAFQTISANLIASDLVAYDPERGTFQGAGEAAGVGFSVGALMQTIGGLVLPHGRRGSAAAGQQGAPSPAAVDAPRLQQQAAVAADLPAGALPAEDVIGAVEAPPPRMAPITEEDRASPLPDASISRGKAIIDDALSGRPLDIVQPEPEPTADEAATEQPPALPPAERETGAPAIASTQITDNLGLVPTSGSGSQAAPPVTVTTGAAQGAVAANDAMPAAAAAPETPAATSAPRASIPHHPLDRDVAVTSGGREVPVRYAIVEAGDLVASQTDDGRSNPAYPQEMQPRDRSRATSQTQINDIAQRLNPRLLDRSARASDGAPIIAEDGVVESGNGRVLAIRRAYAQGGAERYREYLAAQGYPVEGMRAPVLVRIRGGDMSPAERMAFTREANERDTLGMSTTERAMADAAAMPDDLLALYRGGDIDAAGNRDFVRRFIQSVVARNDQAGMIAADGAMSQEAVRRIEAALLARAYGDAALVAELVESADTNIRAIGGALIDMAGVWAGMRADAAAKRIAPEMDQTDALLEAVRLVQRARREGRSLTQIVEQTDMLSGRSISPIGELFLRRFFRNHKSWTQPAGRERIAGDLRFYLTEAGKTQPGRDLLGQPAVSPSDILRALEEKQHGQRDDASAQADLLAKPPGGDGAPVRAVGGERAERTEPGGRPAGGGEGARSGGEGAGAGVASRSQSARQVETAPVVPAPKAGTVEDVVASSVRIEDFGEKIDGARKDARRRLTAALSDSGIDVKVEPLSVSFPRPDYEKLAAEGVDPKALAFVALMRDAIPSKPRSGGKLTRWAAHVAVARELSGRLLSGEKTAAEVQEKIRALGTEYVNLRPLADTVDIIADVPPAQIEAAAKFRVTLALYSMFDSKRYDPPKMFYTLEGPTGRRTNISAETLEAIIPPARSFILRAVDRTKDATTGRKRTPLQIYKARSDGAIFIGFNGYAGVVRLKDGFDTPASAREYMAEHADELQAEIDRMRAGPNERRAENRTRNGPERRDANVTPEKFQEAFGFRGVQFGNYVEGGRRQKDLNEAFDALMDMAETLGVPSRALSLNGELGLAFGARGHGGSQRAKAHFEPVQVVINLTKNAGPGSLAHEWMHALDNYFARQDDGSDIRKGAFVTDRAKPRSVAASMRPEVFVAFQKLVKTLNGSSVIRRSMKVDEARSKPYWSTIIELAARSFEKYIVDRMAAQNIENDYLANIDETSGVYPSTAEMEQEGIREAFDRLFDTIEARETEGGNVALYDIAGTTARANAATEAVYGAPTTDGNMARAVVADLLARIAPNAKVSTPDRLIDPATGRDRAYGLYIDGIIHVALGGPNAQRTARHEAIHYLRQSGYISDINWRTLAAAAREQGWGERFRIRERYGSQGLTESQMVEEAIAEAYAEWAAGGREAKSRLLMAMRWLKRLFDQVRAAIRRAIGRDVDFRDLFSDIETGRTGRGWGVGQSVDPDKPRLEMADTTTDAFRRTGGPGEGQDGAQQPDAAIELAPDVEARLSADPAMAA
ncbi:MAG: LPD5 domain-containing protein, partial [Caenispirillum sp.]|nr:LPD5 domain-containing protein [Caenispirillum sp.]